MSVRFNVKRYFQVLGIALAVILVGVLVCLGFGFAETGQTTADGEIATVESTDGKINVLLMCTDNDGLRTDAIMLASYNTETNEVKMLSIPRDTRMYIGARYQKINAAHALSAGNGKIKGAPATIEAVNRLTGVPINYYVDFSFQAIEDIIDTLGPVTFEIPDLYNDGVGMVYDDPEQNLHINLKPGVQELNGKEVVHLLRYRKGNKNPKTGVRHGYLRGDIDRVAVQQDFMQTLVDQKLNASLILKIPAIFKQISEKIDTNLSVKDVVKYSKYLTNFSSAGIQTFSLPGTDSDSEYEASYWICNLDKTRELIQNEFGYDASNITIDKPGTAPASGGGAKASPAATKKPDSTATKKPASGNSGSGNTKNNTTKATEKPAATKKPSADSKENKSSGNNSSGTKATQKPSSNSGSGSATSKPKATEKPQSVPKKESNSSNEAPQKTKTPVKVIGDDEESEGA